MTSLLTQVEATGTDAPIRELAHRAGDGIEVWLHWAKGHDRLLVSVADSRSDELFELEVSGPEALDAFYHPFAYAAFRGVDDNGRRRWAGRPIELCLEKHKDRGFS